MRKAVQKFLILMIVLFGSSLYGYESLDLYKAIHSSRTMKAQVQLDVTAESNTLKQYAPLSASSDDILLNLDSEPETFYQRYADVAVFPDGKYVVIWEDDRNGDFDIYALLFTTNNELLGENVRLIFDAEFEDQRMPACDVSNSGNLVVAWIDSDGNLYGRVFDENLDPVSDEFKVNDNFGENYCNLPDVSFLHGDSIGFVWEDSRVSENVYCQLYTPEYDPVGENFQINESSTQGSFWSPHIMSGDEEGFAVSWDEITPLGSSVVMKTYTTSGAGISGLVSLPDPASDDQFQTALSHLDGIGYVALWIDVREDSQLVYAQIVDYDGDKNGSNFLISDNPDYVCWDVSSAISGDGSILVTWASYGVRAEILGTRLTAQGDRDGPNISISDPALYSDRFYPKAAIGDDNSPIVAWTDLRSGEHDTYLQRLDDSDSLLGANVELPSVETGAQQLTPDVAILGFDNFIAVWRDMRNDAGDIYIQFVNATGSLYGSNQKVNQDDNICLQSNPAVDGTYNGNAIVVWQDARESDDLVGINIFARRYDPSGTPLGNEIVINDDISSALKAEPDAAQAPTGRSFIVWRDARNSQNDIYAQRIASGGAINGGNLMINTDPALTDNYAPKVGMTKQNCAVVAWRSVVDDRSLVFFQLIGSDGIPTGANTMIASDSSANSHVDFDLAVNQASGEFVIAWINEADSGMTTILAQRYSASGNPVGSAVLLSDMPDLGFDDISVSIDASGTYSACWTDLRTGYRRVYRVLVESDTPGTVTSVAEFGGDTRGEHGSVAMTGNDMITAWSDNRNSGSGYDIYANIYSYSSTPADEIDDEFVMPSCFRLDQNYPNPFNPTTVIRFYLPEAGAVKLEIYNLLGQLVDKTAWNRLQQGWHEYEYDASNQPSGVYFYRIKTDEFVDSRKMILVK